MAESDNQRHIARMLARNAPWSVPSVAVLMLALQPVVFGKPGTSSADVSVLNQRVAALETGYVELTARQRLDQAEVMKMLMSVQSAVSRIEGSLSRGHGS